MLTSRDELDISSRWGWVVLRGVIAVLFGLLFFTRPGPMTLGLVMLFAAYAFVSGIATIIAAARRGRAGASWGMMLLDGVLSIAVAVIAVLWPVSTIVAFVWVLAFWAIFTGVVEIASAIDLRRVIEHEWALGLAGALSVAFGLLLLLRPAAGTLAVVYLLGGYTLLFGASMIALGFKLRSISHGAVYPGAHLPQHG
jgi:uncharacterized membrane protein HdeD (DUF308 family)